MNTGPTRSQIEIQLAELFEGLAGIQAAYGFGSFFRHKSYSDIDIVVVFSADCIETLPVFNAALKRTEALGQTIGVRFDVTPLTEREFKRKPLLESDSLVPLYQRGVAEA